MRSSKDCYDLTHNEGCGGQDVADNHQARQLHRLHLCPGDDAAVGGGQAEGGAAPGGQVCNFRGLLP